MWFECLAAELKICWRLRPDQHLRARLAERHVADEVTAEANGATSMQFPDVYLSQTTARWRFVQYL